MERDYSGPVRVSGSDGTGKTIVALHRATHLARSEPDARIVVATFSDPFARALSARLRRLVSHEHASRNASRPTLVRGGGSRTGRGVPAHAGQVRRSRARVRRVRTVGVSVAAGGASASEH